MIVENGFTLPLHPLQIMSWVIFFYHTIIPPLLISPFLYKPISILFLVLFYLTHLIVFFSGFLATKSIPTIKLSKDPIYLETTENLNFYCTICESYVTKTSKHCGSCDRCVDGFDHHCKWLNNCIGQVNYRLFIFLIVSLEINELILTGFEFKALTLYKSQAILGLIIIDSILNGLIIILVGYLISIHLMLKFKGMTTYEYIKALRKKKEKRIGPSLPVDGNDNKTFERKSLSMNKEVKKSIIKANMNRTVMENICSFSVAKGSVEDAAHMTLQLKFDLDSSNLIIRG